MAHMEYEVIGKTLWFEVEGNCGTDYVEVSVTRYPRVHKLPLNRPIEKDSYSHLFSLLRSYVLDYIESSVIDSITLIEGYGARLTAPGYMDCTQWAVFDTEKEAYEYLSDTYPEDEF